METLEFAGAVKTADTAGNEEFAEIENNAAKAENAGIPQR